jgi:hypothetical protein
MWAVLGRDGQLMSEQGTLLYPEVMMMMMMTFWKADRKTKDSELHGDKHSPYLVCS